MALHPTQVQWFEVRVPREKAVHALETLASSSNVELEPVTEAVEPCFDSVALNHCLDRFDTLQKRLHEELPIGAAEPVRLLQDPVKVAEQAIETLHEWHIRGLELQRQIRLNAVHREQLTLLAEYLKTCGENSTHLGDMGQDSGFLLKHLYACPKGSLDEHPHIKDYYNEVLTGDSRDFWLVVCEPSHQQIVEGTAALLQCSLVSLPDWLPDDPMTQRQMVRDRTTQCSLERVRLNSERDQHRQDLEVRRALSTMRLLSWYSKHAIHHDPEHQSCRISGWTLYPHPDAMEEILRQSDIDARVVFSPPRGELTPPVYLSRRGWAKPFHHLVSLVGAPRRNEVDPTPMLAFLVPLLFGFMFPDLGHGAMLIMLGALATKRYPQAAILIPCGVSAALFGLVFGEMFGATGILPALCGCPLDHPQETLIATLLLGVSIILLGMIFSGIESYWRGELGMWMLEGAPVIVLYLSAATAVIWPNALYITLAAAIWYFAGVAVLCRTCPPARYLHRLGKLVESAFQLVVHTFSFLRVGAFALAHGALSMVVIHLYHSVDSSLAQWTIAILGQVAIVAIEGLVVMIQTTRLILFEFFIRFLRFEGRIYKPLESPNSPSGHTYRSTGDPAHGQAHTPTPQQRIRSNDR
ncbi:MAG: V-type ATPase 116kDa subunit family protein [Candidatus Thiodiazotropha sp.]